MIKSFKNSGEISEDFIATIALDDQNLTKEHKKTDGSSLENINLYNRVVLEKLDSKMVKRASVKYKKSSSFTCNKCDYAAKNINMLNKHKGEEHSSSFNSSKSILGPRHSTRNNSVTEYMMLEDLSSTELEVEEINLDDNSLKYTCIECKYVTVRKEAMDLHVSNKHKSNENEDVKFSCTKCGHDFNEAENYDRHSKLMRI